MITVYLRVEFPRYGDGLTRSQSITTTFITLNSMVFPNKKSKFCLEKKKKFYFCFCKLKRKQALLKSNLPAINLPLRQRPPSPIF